MPVAVTGAGGMVGRALLARLATTGGDVRALVRAQRHVPDLRAIVPRVAVVELEDVEHLTTILHDVHTVIHLAGGLDLPDAAAYERTNLNSTEWVVAAAEAAKVTRLIFLSYPGASPTARNPFLRAKGQAEEVIRASSIPQQVVIRSTHVYGHGSAWLDAMRALARAPVTVVPGTGDARIAPVYIDDVVSVLAAADDRAGAIAGTFGLQGPDELTTDALVQTLAGRHTRIVHVPPARAARLARLARRALSPEMLEILASDSLADFPDAAKEFGVTTTPLQEGLAASA